MDAVNLLTAVERTAVEVLYLRAQAAAALQSLNGRALYDSSYDQRLLDALVPPEALASWVQERYHIAQSPMLLGLQDWMAGRTAVIDQQALDATLHHGITQVAILGAGLDLRAWRLQWPPGCVIYEADTGKSEAIKSRHMAAQPYASTSTRRVFVQADVSRPAELLTALKLAGLDPTAPVLWILEGLVGYLSVEDGRELFAGLYCTSVPGSRVVLTCPPTPTMRDKRVEHGLELHHTTFEEAEDTLGRLISCGWDGSLLQLKDQLKLLDPTSIGRWCIVVGRRTAGQ